LNPHRPIDRLLSSHNNQRILIQQGSALTCVDLVGRRLEWVLPSFGEDDVLPLAISDSGSRLACRVYTPDSGRQGLRVYNINGLEASLFWQWRPDPVEWKVSPAHAATWLDDQRLAVLDSTSFSVWLPEQRMLREVTKTDASSLLVSSPSGNHLGLVFMNRLMMITAASPLQVNAFSMDLPAKTSSVSFQSGGDLAFASGGARAAVVDMRSGQITPVANELFKNSRAQWIDNRHMLIDGQWVAKTDQQKPIARFTAGLKNSNDRVWWVESLADKLVIVDPERGRLMLRNFSSLLPVESNGAERQPQYAVDHGAGVAISISGSAVGPFRTQVENRLRTIIDQNGWKFDAKSSLVLSGNIESITEPMEFSVTGLLAGKDAERITPTYYRFTVGLRRGSEVYHSAGYSTLATRITTLPAGKTLEQVVTERSRFRPELIESASIPAQIEAKKRGPDYLVIDVSMIESE
jgi:hypothetical protein